MRWIEAGRELGLDITLLFFLPTESLCVVESILMNQYVLIVQ